MSYDIILTCNYSPWSRYSGGGQKSTHMLATALAQSGKKVMVVYSKTPWEKVPTPKNLPYQIQWAFFFAFRPGISSPLRWMNGLSFFFKVKALSSISTILHGNGDEASILGTISNKKIFIYSHRYPDFPSFMYKTDWNSWNTRVRIFFREPRFSAIALALRNAHSICCTSRDSIQKLKICFQVEENKTALIHNGVDPYFLQSPLKEEGGKGVLYFGRLTRAKGVQILLKAYAGLSENVRHAHHLTIVGQGPMEETLRNQVRTLKLKNVHFLTWCSGSDLAEKIRQHKIVVLPSLEESFGNTMLETLAVGGVLITTAAGSIPEVVGEFASLVPPLEAVALKLAMRDDLESTFDRDRAVKQRQYVTDNFSWVKTARQYLAEYEREAP